MKAMLIMVLLCSCGGEVRGGACDVGGTVIECSEDTNGFGVEYDGILTACGVSPCRKGLTCHALVGSSFIDGVCQ